MPMGQVSRNRSRDVGPPVRRPEQDVSGAGVSFYPVGSRENERISHIVLFDDLGGAEPGRPPGGGGREGRYRRQDGRLSPSSRQDTGLGGARRSIDQGAGDQGDQDERYPESAPAPTPPDQGRGPGGRQVLMVGLGLGFGPGQDYRRDELLGIAAASTP
jgi:hypothetical protein